MRLGYLFSNMQGYSLLHLHAFIKQSQMKTCFQTMSKRK